MAIPNIIRTHIVELVTIPAMAYKQKLSAGGAGIKILRIDQDANAVFTLDKGTGAAIPRGKVDAKLFPEEAVQEAMELTSGLPYTARGKVHIKQFTTEIDIDDVADHETEKTDMVESEEYQAIVSRYINEKGVINYTLMNKDFIQYASKSKTVANMVSEGASREELLTYIVKNRAAFIANKKENLTDKQTEALIETLDEINPRSAFKELKNYIVRILATAKR